jgi:SulP family sulfate permease
VLLIASGINFVDTTGLECLEHCSETLKSGGLTLHLAEVKGPVMDQLERGGFPERLGRGHFHLSTHEALQELGTRPRQPRSPVLVSGA